MNASAEDCLPDSELVAPDEHTCCYRNTYDCSALCRTLLTLAHHQDAQARLHEEIHPAMDEHGELDYDALSNLSYLDAVCRETLRWYPLVITVTRTAREDIVLPFSCPFKENDGKYMHDVLDAE
ncbi:cytochrome P450 [Suillus paluster]|uniref:cytochrome P450 n=1 Tax=Suillus paluster TaxID=48578 RepID=UPI001B864B62|nr:cytochrome P450 [Suillus paluster]KAG1725801.1 cytochrome P450 [Suillus paluster]